MATNYTPLVNGANADATVFNGPLEQLDLAVENMVGGSKALSTPTVTSFTNSQHNHSNAAGGGKLGLSALSVAGAAGLVLVTDGANGVTTGAGPGLPSGAVIPYAGSSAPSGWLLCAGQAVSRTTYATLFAAIGTTYGAGDGSTTFNLPDLRGRFPLGADNMGGSSANRVTATQADNLGQGTGAETHTLITGEIPSHSHDLAANSGATSSTSGTIPMRATSSSGTWATNNTGGGAAHNNMPPYLTLNYIIKT